MQGDRRLFEDFPFVLHLNIESDKNFPLRVDPARFTMLDPVQRLHGDAGFASQLRLGHHKIVAILLDTIGKLHFSFFCVCN